MDRDIDPNQIRARNIKRIIAVIFFAAVAVTILVLGPGLFRTRLTRQNLTIAKVEAGPLTASIYSTGTVEPELEHVIASPFATRVLRVLKQPGTRLQRGEAFLELDTNQARLAAEKIGQQIKLKRNQQNQSRLELSNTLISLNSQLGVKQLELESARTNSGRMRQLFRDGLLSQSQLDQALLEEQKTSLEQAALDAKIKQAGETTQVQLDGLEMEMAMLEKEWTEARRQLELATASADCDGVLTWVRQEEGAAVPAGDVLGRIADLSSFRVKVTVSDVHSGQLTSGMPVMIRLNENRLAGQIRSVLPTITNGTISLIAGLDDPAAAFLKPNLRVDVEIVTEHRARTLRLKRGPAVKPGSVQDLYVIRNGWAKKTKVNCGLASFDECEVLAGLAAGDEVIISTMDDYSHLSEIQIK